MLKTLPLLTLILLTLQILPAQNTVKPPSTQSSHKLYPIPPSKYRMAENHERSLTETKDHSFSKQAPNRPGKTQSIIDVPLGTSSNGYGSIRNHQNQIYTDSTGVIAFIHRQDVTIWGGGGAMSGVYRYDYSTDFGTNWTIDAGPLQTANTYAGRYPQLTGFNPAGTVNPADQKLVWSGAALSGTSTWYGHVYGATNMTTSIGTENYLFGLEPTLIPGSLCEGLPGEFWNIDLKWTATNGYEDVILLFKGVWNPTTQDVDWNIHMRIPIDADHLFDGLSHTTVPVISFSPDGNIGWIAFVGDLTETSAPMGQDSAAYAPCFLKSTDGGATWGTPVEVNLNNISWIKDTLQHTWIDSVGNPLASGVVSTGYDFDLTVDKNGNPHLGVAITNGGLDYSLETGYKMFLGHVFSPDGGSTFDCEFMSPIYTMRGEVGNGPDPLVYDNHVQVSRDHKGDFVMFSWVDTDTSITGYGNPENSQPDLWIAGKDIRNNYTACRWPVTWMDVIWSGKAYFPTMGPEFYILPDGEFYLPIIAIELLTNDPLAPVKYHLLRPIYPIYGFRFVPHIYYLSNSFKPFKTPCSPDYVADSNLGNKSDLISGLYPNPTSNHLTIELDLPAHEVAVLEIVNANGQVIHQRSILNRSDELFLAEFSLENCAVGLYLCTIRTSQTTQTKRFIIER